MHACMLSHFSHVRLCAIPWTTAHQASLSTGFPRQEYWSGLPYPSPYSSYFHSPFYFSKIRSSELSDELSFILDFSGLSNLFFSWSAKGLSVLLIFAKEPAFGFIDSVVICSLIMSALIFIISFILPALESVLFSGFFSWEVRLLIWDFFFFFF